MGKWEFWVFFILIVVFPILQWITRTRGKLAKTPERRPSHRPPAPGTTGGMRKAPKWGLVNLQIPSRVDPGFFPAFLARGCTA